jgi:hypothetical protein
LQPPAAQSVPWALANPVATRLSSSKSSYGECARYCGSFRASAITLTYPPLTKSYFGAKKKSAHPLAMG